MAAAAIIPIVTGLVPSIKELVSLIPNTGKKKQLVAAMARGTEASLRKLADSAVNRSSALQLVEDQLSALVESGGSLSTNEIRLFALTVSIAMDTDARDRAALSQAIISHADALDAAMDHLVGEDDPK